MWRDEEFFCMLCSLGGATGRIEVTLSVHCADKGSMDSKCLRTTVMEVIVSLK
jgi:hypothetical protein